MGTNKIDSVKQIENDQPNFNEELADIDYYLPEKYRNGKFPMFTQATSFFMCIAIGAIYFLVERFKYLLPEGNETTVVLIISALSGALIMFCHAYRYKQLRKKAGRKALYYRSSYINELQSKDL